VADLEGHLLFVNRAFATMHGYSPEELVGKHLSVFHTSDQMSSVETANHRIRDTGEFKGEIWHVRSDGIVFPAMMHNSLLRDDAGIPVGLIGTLRDITERKQAEEALRESEERFHQIFDNMNSGVAVYEATKDGQDFIFKDFNRAAERIEQITRQDLIGKSVTQVFPGVIEFGLFEVIQRVWRTGTAERHPISLYKDKRIAGWRENYVCKLPSGQIVVIYDDVTERTELESQLLQAQKMESVGRLAGGVAHDFNNMLTVMLGHTELALDKVDPGNPIHADLQEVLKTGKRSVAIIRQLLAFARKQIIEPYVLNLNETLEGMLRMLRRLIGEDIELVWLPESGLWPVYADPSQIDQLLANLCVNARDAISGVGRITIETENVFLDEAYCAGHAGFFPGEYGMLAVSDNGCGMEKEILDKVFEPFFTTKKPGKGTGLGLSTVYGIVRQHQGFINVYSEPGKGTNFKIYLPRHGEETGAGPEDSADKIPQGRGETILVVEDEASVLEVGRMILEKLGYRVLTAGTPDEAMRVIREYTGEIHLLLTDVVMPEMSGKDLAEQITEIRRGTRVLFMSGYTSNAISLHEMLGRGAHFIQKPLITDSLARKIREVLG
jgi:PAS domain S-box-containing protein